MPQALTDTDKMITMNQFVGRESIAIACDWAPSNPNMDASDHMNHHKVTLRRSFGRVRRSMTLIFSMGPALTGEPSAADVLDCLASDASGVENAQSFEDWCSEYGYDADSRRAERTWRVCQRQSAKLRAFLGDDAFDQLLWHTERL